MKKLSLFLSLLVVLVSCTGNSQNTPKRYDIKSGIVDYKTTITGKVMGSKISGSGEEHLYFKDYGALEVKEATSSQTSVMKFFGKEKKETKDEHSLSKLDNGKSYSVDFKNKQITVRQDPMMDINKQSNSNASDDGKNMLESMGGKKIGQEKFMGYDCEIWEIMGGKQWIYKGVKLKMDMNVMGMNTITEATSAKFDISVADSYLKLPDFPIQKTESFLNNEDFQDELNSDEVKEGMEVMKNLSFEEWKKMVIEGDPEMKNMSDEELRQSYDMMQKMLKMNKGK